MKILLAVMKAYLVIVQALIAVVQIVYGLIVLTMFIGILVLAGVATVQEGWVTGGAVLFFGMIGFAAFGLVSHVLGCLFGSEWLLKELQEEKQNDSAQPINGDILKR